MRTTGESKRIAAAARGLMYPSETDAPLTPFHWRATTGATAADAVAAHAKRAVTEVPLDAFFAELVTSDDGPRWRQLRAVLAAELADLKVFRVATRRVDIYLIGRTRAGAWAGLHTISVET